MNSNERELERANYDNWKLSNQDDLKRTEWYGFLGYDIPKRKLLGKCPCCEEDVLENELFVEEDDEVFYHFSCYNYKIAEEDKEDGK